MSATVMEAAACSSGTGDLVAELTALRRELQQLRRQVAELRWEAGYWKSRHADSLKRNESLQEELAQTKAELRKLQGRLFGRKSERRATGEQTDLLEQAEEESRTKQKRGAQPGQKGHGRRDLSHLPAREESIEVSQDRRVCPRSGKALESLQNHWDGLVRFVDDAGIPMDNNRSQRLLRGPAMGRKNYYGSGAKWSGRLA